MRLERQQPVTYYENGAERWQKTSKWHGAKVLFKALHQAGNASLASPGRLSFSEAAATAPGTLAWNPGTGLCARSTPLWTAGVASGTPCEEEGSVNNAYGLSYQLPITQPLHLLGPMTARLYVSSRVAIERFTTMYAAERNTS